MLCNTLLKKKKLNSICYNLKYKINKKYKKTQKLNKYLIVYNPRKELNIYNSLTIHKNKFYTK